jgi:hypothetical protein
MRHRLTIILGLALALAMASGALAGTVDETFVEGGGGNQFSGDGNTTYLTWAANTTARPKHYDSLFRLLAGGNGRRRSPTGTSSTAATSSRAPARRGRSCCTTGTPTPTWSSTP